MPGPYHIALARPIMTRWTHSGEERYGQEIHFALSENYHDTHQRPLWRFFRIKGGLYPYWFLSENEYHVLNNGLYLPAPDSYLSQV